MTIKFNSENGYLQLRDNALKGQQLLARGIALW